MTRINQLGWLSTPHHMVWEQSCHMFLMTVRKNQSRIHPAVSQQVSKITLWSKQNLWQLCFALRNSISTCLEEVFHCFRITDLLLYCLVLNVVFLSWPHPARNGGLSSCQLISMILNSGLRRITATLIHCLNCHERPWNSRMIGASKLIKIIAFKWNEHQSQCLKSTRPRSSSLSCDVLHFARLASGKFHFRRVEDLLQ